MSTTLIAGIRAIDEVARRANINEPFTITVEFRDPELAESFMIQVKVEIDSEGLVTPKVVSTSANYHQLQILGLLFRIKRGSPAKA